MVNPVKTAGVVQTPILTRADRVSSERASIGAMIAVMSRELPMQTAQQLAGQTVSAKLTGTDQKGNTVFEVNGQKVPVKMAPDARLPPVGSEMTLLLALDTEISTPGSSTLTDSALKSLNGVAKLVTPDGETITDQPQQGSTVDDLSDTARLLTRINQQPDKQALVVSLPNTALDAPTIAKTLNESVEHSGLFYESHLKQWTDGERSKEVLLKDPQAKWEQQGAITEKSVFSQESTPAAKMVAGQLDILDTGKLRMQLLGPENRPIDIELEQQGQQGQQSSEQATEDPAQTAWSAKLKLDMQHLGELRIFVQLVGQTISVQMQAPASAANQINQSWDDFANTLRENGLQLGLGQVKSNDGGVSTDETLSP